MSRTVNTVCLLGFGEVGSTLARDLVLTSSVRLIVWDKLFPERDSLPNRRLANVAANERIVAATSANEAVKDADLVVSAVTAEQDMALAKEVCGSLQPQAWYLDLNSVSPNTKIKVGNIIESAGGRYVEAAVMAPILPKGINTRIILSGQQSATFMEEATTLGFGDTTVLSEVPGRAAASKMCRSIVVKGLEALITESLLSARHYGVEEEVIASLDNLLPSNNWHVQAGYMLSRSLQHGNRRAEEMQEAVKTVRDAGVTPWMSEGCVRRQQWAGGSGVSHEPPVLNRMLDELREIASSGNNRE